ncbi:MAG: DUF4340 domain-containing protein [Saccharofermentans sp.]|nr:DUF4340 domain-containing protein [Saccharofermentans sp.]
MKSAKNLLIPLIVLIVLAVAVVGYFIYKNANKPEETLDTMIDVLYIGSQDVQSVEVRASAEGSPVVKVSCNASDLNNIVYTYEGSDKEEGATYSQRIMSSYISLLSTYSCDSLISSSGNFSEYGLDNPAYTVTVTTITGETYIVYLGNRTIDGTMCYMRLEGSNDVYTVGVGKIVEAGMVSVNFLEAQLLNISFDNLDTVTFVRKSDDLTISATCEIYEDTGEPQYFIYEPFTIQASPYFENLIEYVATLEISEYMEIADEDLASYGLDDPNYQFTLNLKDGTKKVVYFSENMAGFYYGYVAGMDKYFMVSDMQIKGLDTPVMTLLDSYVASNAASNISSIKGTNGEESFLFELNVAESQSISADDSTVTLDGRNAKVFNSDGRSYCATLYEAISCIALGGFDTTATVDTSSDPLLTLTIVTKDYTTHVYSFYTRDESSSYVVIDGEYSSFYVYNKELFNDGGTDTYSYGVWPAYELLKTAIDENVNGVYDIS